MLFHVWCAWSVVGSLEFAKASPNLTGNPEECTYKLLSWQHTPLRLKQLNLCRGVEELDVAHPFRSLRVAVKQGGCNYLFLGHNPICSSQLDVSRSLQPVT